MATKFKNTLFEKVLFTIIYFIFSTTNSTKAFDTSSCASQPDLTIIPVYGKCSPFKPTPGPWADTIINMASKDPARLDYLASLVARRKPVSSAPTASGQAFNIGGYVVRARLGTPGQLMFMVLDTSTDEAWVPCTGCTGCQSTSSPFSPTASATYGGFITCSATKCYQARGAQTCPASPGSTSACTFNQSYGGAMFSATLVHDSISLARETISKYSFGCVNSVSGGSIPAQGLLGLGRGPLSLISQSLSLYSGVFSYCLPSFRSYYFSGSLKLGPLGQPRRIQTTPLLRNPRRPSLYYVNLTGVSVGRVRIPLPREFLAFNPNTGSGTIIDSGTVITRFVQPVYNAVRDEFRRQVKGSFSSLGAFDTCFEKSYERLAPTMKLHFEGLDLKLPFENSLIHSSSGSLACLAMAAAPNNVNSVLNVIANLQQQNLRILFDTVNNKVGIARELCN
ncbi:Aspartyl protease aed3 [Stylosanthes scabra]|uniref:Aspartyl protease aed3 n=1 Tax=Stylosanthes scabra TaxID=79078 RepID=A0ABU6YIK1_9FABA|nr:Aspartyl protease aed3 [Stylosanthes scabra]